MCGICGTAGFSSQDLLERMLALLVHRGPNEKGLFSDGKSGLGIRRLSIIDLTTGHQPLHNEQKTIWAVVNGEIYNFRELKENLEKKGHYFYTKTDTEVIVHLYEEYGDDCVNYLRGMFSFAVWDKNEASLLLARDRIGIKPLYYTVNNGNLVFASEIKAILEYNEIEREINFEALDYYLTFLYIPVPLTIFKGIYKLPPASVLKFKNRTAVIKQYWDLPAKKLGARYSVKDKVCCAEQLYDLLKEAVKLRLVSDVPLGVFLSGGVDSSAIVGLMAGLMSRPVKTFSLGYESKDRTYNELKYARLIAEHFGTNHQEVIVRPDVVKLLPEIVRHFDEPFADSSAIPTFIVSQAAKQKVSVALTGIGGDECWGGYPRYVGAHLAEYYQRLPVWFRKQVFRRTQNLHESTESRNLTGWVKRFAYGGVLSAEERYIDWISFLREEERNRLYTPGTLNRLEGINVYRSHRGYFQKAETKIFLDKIFYLDVKTYLSDDLLCMADRMGMANSLELRLPFCDSKLLEFSASIPYELKIKGLNLKALFKGAVSKLLPGEIVNRGKCGFMIPLGRWLKDELKDLTMDLLSEANVKKRGYFNYGYIRWMLEQHYENKRNFSDQIYALLSFELWNEIYIDQSRKMT